MTLFLLLLHLQRCCRPRRLLLARGSGAGACTASLLALTLAWASDAGAAQPLSGMLWHNDFSLDLHRGVQVSRLDGAAPVSITNRGDMDVAVWPDGRVLVATKRGVHERVTAMVVMETSGRALHKLQMDGYVSDLVPSPVSRQLVKLSQAESPSSASQELVLDLTPAIQEFQRNFADELTATILKNLGKTAAGSDSTTGKTGGGKAGGGWLQAIAAAMGEHLGNKAAEMVSLTEQMTALDKGSAAITKQVAAAGEKLDSGKSKGGELEGAKSADQANARKFNMLMTQFQATSQEYSMLNNTFSTAIKALGEALSSMARKQ